VTHPSWWPAWVPQRCDEGHEFRPGTVRVSPRRCDCGGQSRIHQVYLCATCYQEFWPPTHREGYEGTPDRIIL